MADPSWKPEVAELAPLMRARLSDSGDGGFTSTSFPTAEDAENAIRGGVDRVLTRVGTVPDGLHSSAARVALYQAAADLEAGLTAEQTRGDLSPRPHWQKLADDRLKELADAVDRGGAGDDGTPDTDLGVGGLPVWAGAGGPYVSEMAW